MRNGKLEEALAVTAMAMLVAITLLNVVTRYFTDESFAWTEELSVFLMVVMALAGASAVALRDQHIRIEFLFTRRTVRGEDIPRRSLKLLGSLLTSAVFALLAALFVRWVWDQYKFSETSMGLGVPLWWYGAAMPVLCLAIATRAAWAFWRTLKESPEAEASEKPQP
jgi:TRAP-type C4-dicarboxylate transport system permease small subunit